MKKLFKRMRVAFILWKGYHERHKKIMRPKYFWDASAFIDIIDE